MLHLASISPSFDWDTILRILLAMALGGVVGLEREFAGRAAGFRTHILVCVGSTIIVLASAAIPRLFDTTFMETIRIDPGRIAAGIVTGIGFLGAGAILKTGEFVRGLTTAACIWFAAALGIVIGEGFFGLAVTSTILVLLVLQVDRFFGHRIRVPIYRNLLIRVKSEHSKALVDKFEPFFKKHRIRIQDMDCGFEKADGESEIKLYLRTRKTLQSFEIVSALKNEPGLISIRWQN